ncbi:MAG: 2-oxoacid:acceptor oxidoreductase family protein [candidate division KSB1 bacterium]|nr:2-oxoacid:acceptor oxidoreductase family protein [candidate division KSB1 bacterium]
MTEIRWHGRGGQGAKTAALLLAEAAIDVGRYAQAFPEYGPERTGAPVRAFTRISDKPIRLHSPIENPDTVVVLDPTLLEVVDVTEGLAENGAVIINTSASKEETAAKLSRQDRVRLYVIDATKLALETIGRPIPNTVMLGALVGATDVLPFDVLVEDLRHMFSKKFSASIAEMNVEAVRRAYEEVKKA